MTGIDPMAVLLGPFPVDPACWSWPVPTDAAAMITLWNTTTPERFGRAAHASLLIDALRLYDRGLCAICGRPGNEVEDHDHTTGRTRGWLCRSCNTREGMNHDPDSVFGRYRVRYPYLILGIDMPYDGRGWTLGEPDEGWNLHLGR